MFNQRKLKIILIPLFILILMISLIILAIKLSSEEEILPLENDIIINQTWLNFGDSNQRINMSTMPTNRTNYTFFALINLKSLYTNYSYIPVFKTGDFKTILRFNNMSGNPVLDTNTLNDTSTGSLLPLSLNKWELIGFSINNDAVEKKLYASVGSVIERAYGNMTSSYYLTLGGDMDNRFLNASLDDIYIYDQTCVPTDYDILYSYVNNPKVNNTLLPTIMIHQVDNYSSDNAIITEDKFRALLSFMKSLGYETITDKELYDYNYNNFSMPRKPFILSFDDGINNTIRAAEIMGEYGYRGITAISTSLINTSSTYLGNKYMTWEDVRNLIDNYGWGVASHSHIHCRTSSNSPTAINCTNQLAWSSNMSLSKQYIIGNLSYNPVMFVYPYNGWNATIMVDCLNIYTYCTAHGFFIGTQNNYAKVKGMNMTNGDFQRIGIDNTTTLSMLQNAFNSSGCTPTTILRLNENTGTTVYDLYGNKNGTIQGATWQSYS